MNAHRNTSWTNKSNPYFDFVQCDVVGCKPIFFSQGKAKVKGKGGILAETTRSGCKESTGKVHQC